MSQTSKKDQQQLHRKQLLGFVDDLHKDIESFIQEADFYIMELDVDDIDVAPLRSWQSRLSRLNTDLQNLYRRLDT